jgi:hypothetical protein
MAIIYIPMYRVCIVRSYNVGAHTTSISVEDKGRRAVVVDSRKAVFTDREAQKIRKETILTSLIRKGFWLHGFFGLSRIRRLFHLQGVINKLWGVRGGPPLGL